LQAKKLKTATDLGLIGVEEVSSRPGGCYYMMPIITGQTLRRYMTAGPVPISHFIDIANCLERLTDNKAFLYHGDLKPENIMVSPLRVVLIDPGHFGSVDTYSASIKQTMTNCAVTSTIYYPTLVPDDLLAFGIIMWETACREHPLSKRAHSADFDKRTVGSGLWQYVKEQENEGRFYSSRILGLRRPSAIRPGMPKEIEDLLLRGMRLQIDANGKIDRGEGFNSFAEIAESLNHLLSKNIRYI
jgi:serine/threonine protein kinase